MNKSAKLLYAVGVAIVSSLTFLSCTEDGLWGSRRINDENALALVVNVDGVSRTASRSFENQESFIIETFEMGGDTLCLMCTVTDINDGASLSATRGTPIYTKTGNYNLQTVYGEFNASFYENGDLDTPLPSFDLKTDTPIPGTGMINTTYAYDSQAGTTNWQYWLPKPNQGEFCWKEGKVHRIFAYAPTSLELDGTNYTADGDNITDGDIVFEYEVPVSTSSPRQDALAQPDVLVTSTDILERPETRDDHIQLFFYHVLSAIRFNVSNNMQKQNLTIESVGLSGLKGEGTCTFVCPEGDYTNHSYDLVTWSDYGTGNASYEQYFGREITDTEAQNMSEANPVELNKKADGTDWPETTFMLLPQELSSNSMVEVTITYNDGTVTHTKTLTHLILGSGATKDSEGNVTYYGKWEPGRIYTYSISKVPGVPTVAVDDNVTATVKSNVAITNTSLATGYLRATIVGNWVDETGEIVASWSPSDANQGTFVFPSPTKWVKGDDGYYYYPDPLLPGQTLKGADALFTSYTIKGTGGTYYCPVEGSHLEMQIVSQIIEAGNPLATPAEALDKYVKAAWQASANKGDIWSPNP